MANMMFKALVAQILVSLLILQFATFDVDATVTFFHQF